MKIEETYILDVKVDFGYTLDSTVKKVKELISGPTFSHQICTTNPEFILEAQKNKHFSNIINTSDLSLPDGVGVLYAKKFLDEVKHLKSRTFFPILVLLTGLKVVLLSLIKRGYLGEKVTGVSLVEKLSSLEKEEDRYSLFFLGGWPKDKMGRRLDGSHNVALEAAQELKTKYPGMLVVGATSEFSPFEKDDQKTLTYIHECMHKSKLDSIDIVFVAYGHPNQEIWIKRMSKKIPAKLCIGVGGTFDYFSGRQLPPSTLFVKSNTEWLFRLISQPWRLGRIFSAILVFPIKIYLSALK